MKIHSSTICTRCHIIMSEDRGEVDWIHYPFCHRCAAFILIDLQMSTNQKGNLDMLNGGAERPDK